MREIRRVFKMLRDPLRGNARSHDLHETLAIAMLSTLTGGRMCCWSGTTSPASRRRQGGRGAASRGWHGERRRSLQPAQREAGCRALRADRPIPLGDRERRCSASDACTGARRVDGRGPGAQPQGQRRRLPGRDPAAGSEHRPMHPDKRSVRRKFLHAQRKQEFLVDMIRIRRSE